MALVHLAPMVLKFGQFRPGAMLPVVGMPFIMTTAAMLFTHVILIVTATMMVMIIVR